MGRIRTHAVIFGKPETGRPIPAEQISAVACKLYQRNKVRGDEKLTMMSNRGCGSSSDSPIRVAIGTSSTAAIVCEILKALASPQSTKEKLTR